MVSIGSKSRRSFYGWRNLFYVDMCYVLCFSIFFKIFMFFIPYFLFFSAANCTNFRAKSYFLTSKVKKKAARCWAAFLGCQKTFYFLITFLVNIPVSVWIRIKYTPAGR